MNATKYRPVSYSDITKPGAPIVGWGLERRDAGAFRFYAVAIGGELHPFPTRRVAAAVAQALNDAGKARS